MALPQLSEYIDDTEDFINIFQDTHRNKLIQLDLVMTSLTFSITLLSMIASVFGMNVPSGLEDDVFAFANVVGSAGTISLLGFVGFVGYSKREQLL